MQMEQSPYRPPHPDSSKPFRSSPLAALKAPIQTPNWIGNLLWLSLAGLTSSVFIGQIALMGYGAELLVSRAGRPENESPDIDSNRLGDYLSLGIWPFLVQLVVQVVATLVILLPMMLIFGMAMAIAAVEGGESGALISMFLLMPILGMLSIVAGALSVPFLIRAMVCQDFTRSFDISWALGFMKLMFWEIVLSTIVFAVLAMLVALVGFAAFCVGQIPAVGLILGGMVNLLAQWYEIYLSLGGEPAPAAESGALAGFSAGMSGSDDDVVDASLVD